MIDNIDGDDSSQEQQSNSEQDKEEIENLINSNIFVSDEPPEFISADAYRLSIPLQILKFFLLLATGGIFGLFYLWFVRFNFLFELRCSPAEADKFLIMTIHKNFVWTRVKKYKGVKYFEFWGIRYVFDGTRYSRAPSLHKRWTQSHILRMYRGREEASITPFTYACEGSNIIRVPVPTLFKSIIDQLLDPNYIYMYLCCLLWFFHDYAVFAGVILGTSLISGIYDSWETRKVQLRIKRMAKYIVDIPIFRDGSWKVLPSSELFPGDIVELPNNKFKVPCDMVLISGSALVDETSLTGESLPVVKLKPKKENKVYDAEKDRKITIYAGTDIIGVLPCDSKDKNLQKFNGKAVAVVTRTGYKTAKGNLVRSILSSKRITYSYEKEAKIMLLLLIVAGICLFFYSLHLWGSFDEFDPEDLMFGFEAIAIIVPPMLPTLFHIGLLLSAKILRTDFEVFTADPSRIPQSGRIDVLCFDKTGTLTKDDLDMIGIVPCAESKGKLVFQPINPINTVKQEHLLRVLTTCHTLSKVNQQLLDPHSDKTLSYSGTTVDIKMFESTGWQYSDGSEDEPPFVTDPSGSTKLEILKRFDFDPALQRMSALVRDTTSNKTYVVCKGSPEVILGICKKEAIPKNYERESKFHSQNGCYVLGLAYKEVDLGKLNQIQRSQIENDLKFQGFMLLRNELKPDTAAAIKALTRGRIRSLIITGDNIYTAFYIGKKCKIVSKKQECFIGDVVGDSIVWRGCYNSDLVLDILRMEIIQGDKRVKVNKENIALGVTSSAWEVLTEDPSNNTFLINEVKIFARMKPLQKEAVVRLIATENHIVGMCGDGANDCAALSAAHCGIALSEAEASVVSPFTARRLSIMSVVDLVREARCCLANSFAVFKFTLAYGIVQTVQMLVSYQYGADLSELEYIFIDFGMFLPMAFFVVKSLSTKRLKNDPPVAKVFGPRTMTSLCGAVAIAVMMIEVSRAYLDSFTWYIPTPLGKNTFQTPETTAVWFVGCFSYIGTALSYSLGSDWRKPFYYNVGLMLLVCYALMVLTVAIWIYPSWDVGGFYDTFQMVSLPMYVRGIYYMMGWMVIMLQMLFEAVVVIRLGDHLKERMKVRTVWKGGLMESISSGTQEDEELLVGRMEDDEHDDDEQKNEEVRVEETVETMEAEKMTMITEREKEKDDEEEEKKKNDSIDSQEDDSRIFSKQKEREIL